MWKNVINEKVMEQEYNTIQYNTIYYPQRPEL